MTTVTSKRGWTSYPIFWSVTLTIVLLDQGTKLWIDGLLPFGTYYPYQGPGGASPIVVIEGFFQIVHIGNEGAAWGILSGYRIFLVTVAVVALLAIYFCRVQLELKQMPMQWAFGLIVGGIIGNVLDRVLYGHVVDFIDITLPGISAIGWEPYRWPAFNVADSGITCGVILYLIFSFQSARTKSSESNKVSSDH